MRRAGGQLLGWLEDLRPIVTKTARKREHNAFWLGVDAAHHLNVMPWDDPAEEAGR